MKRLFVAGIVGGLLAAPIGIGLADNGVATYANCLSTSEGKALNSMEVRVDRYVRGLTDQDGCFSVQLATDQVHDITLIGKKSMLNAVPDSNGFSYNFTYRTDVITADMNEAMVVPVTPVIVEVNGVDGVAIQDPKLQLHGNLVMTMPSGQEVRIIVRGDIATMTGANNTVLFGLVDGMEASYDVLTPAGTSYEPYRGHLAAPTGTPYTAQAVLQYPAPEPVEDVTTAVDATGNASLSWNAVAGTASVRVYQYDSAGNLTQLADLSPSVTTYQLGQLHNEGSYSYAIRTANQYGYEGLQSRGANVIWDTHAPTTLSVSVNTDDIEVGTTAAFNALFHDNETGLLKGEYFIGADPGQGNGTEIGQVDETGAYVDQFGSDLAVGTYVVGVRAVDVNGNWTGVSFVMLNVHESPIEPPVEE